MPYVYFSSTELTQDQIKALDVLNSKPAADQSERADATGYWTNYARITAAFQSGSAVSFHYVKPSPPLTARRAEILREAIILGPIQTSDNGDHYVKAVDLNADGPRTFRIDRMRNVSAV